MSWIILTYSWFWRINCYYYQHWHWINCHIFASWKAYPARTRNPKSGKIAGPISGYYGNRSVWQPQMGKRIFLWLLTQSPKKWHFPPAVRSLCSAISGIALPPAVGIYPSHWSPPSHGRPPAGQGRRSALLTRHMHAALYWAGRVSGLSSRPGRRHTLSPASVAGHRDSTNHDDNLQLIIGVN